MSALKFLREHWKKLLVLAAVALAFAGGRASVPDKPAEVRVEEKVVYKDRIVEVEKRVEVQAEAKRVVVYRDRVVKPDGTTVEREVSKTDTAAARSEAAEKTLQAATEVATKVDQKVTERRQPWRVGLLVGIDANTLQAPVVVGLAAEHEVVWGLHAGLWATLPVQQARWPTLGLSLSYRF